MIWPIIVDRPCSGWKLETLFLHWLVERVKESGERFVQKCNNPYKLTESMHNNQFNSVRFTRDFKN